jgi:serine/threonine-protein kinase SRPK3
MISLLGPPPSNLLARVNGSSRFFTKEGTEITNVCISQLLPMTDQTGRSQVISSLNLLCLMQDHWNYAKKTLRGEEKARFLRFVNKMLRWEASERSPAHELVNDEWIHSRD